MGGLAGEKFVNVLEVNLELENDTERHKNATHPLGKDGRFCDEPPRGESLAACFSFISPLKRGAREEEKPNAG